MVYQRYAYWCKKGHFERLFQGAQQPDMEEVMMDRACCRAYQASEGARKTSGPQAIGITRGGLNYPKSAPSATPWATHCGLC